MTKRRASVLWALGAAFLVAVVVACALPGKPSPDDPQRFIAGGATVTVYQPNQRGEVMDLAGTDSAGATLDVADWRGDVTVLNIWYASCGPCRAEAPELVNASAELAPEGVRFVGLNTRDDPASAAAFERTFNVTYPSIIDQDGQSVVGIPKEVNVSAVPSTMVVDRDGRIAAEVKGATEASVITGLVKDVLAEKPGQEQPAAESNQ